MAKCSKHHKELIDGVGKCSKPMWDGYGMPAGFCDRPAYGKPTEEGQRRYSGYVPHLACPNHGGPTTKTIERRKKVNRVVVKTKGGQEIGAGYG